MTTQTISIANQVAQKEGNIVSNMGEEKVMLSIQNGKYYNLGEIGGRIWELMASPISVEEMTLLLMKDFEVQKKTCEEHVVSFLNQLMEEGLIDVVDDSSIR